MAWMKEVVLSRENLNQAYKKVVANKEASGIDGVTVKELGDHIRENREGIINSLRSRAYFPKPVRTVKKTSGYPDRIRQDNSTGNSLAESSWIERKLFLRVNPTKSKVTRPMKSKYLGFTFLKNGGQWKVKPTDEKKAKLYQVMREYLKRGKAIARPLTVTIKRVNQIVLGWINYFRIGMMKQFMKKFGQWLRHKIRVILIKQWKRPKIIFRNLSYLNRRYKNGFNEENIFKVANSRLDWYKRCGMNVVNYILNPNLLEIKIKGGAGLLNPLNYYLRKVGI